MLERGGEEYTHTCTYTDTDTKTSSNVSVFTADRVACFYRARLLRFGSNCVSKCERRACRQQDKLRPAERRVCVHRRAVVESCKEIRPESCRLWKLEIIIMEPSWLQCHTYTHLHTLTHIFTAFSFRCVCKCMCHVTHMSAITVCNLSVQETDILPLICPIFSYFKYLLMHWKIYFVIRS